MSGQRGDTVGMDRRELLERAAWMSGAGALAWAAPAVTTFGARAAAGTGEPPPPGGGIIGIPDGSLAISYLALIFNFGGDRYGAKIEFSNSNGEVGVRWGSNGNSPFCDTHSDGTSVAQFKGLPNLSEAGFAIGDPPIRIENGGEDGTNLVLTSLDSRLTFAAFAIKQATACFVTSNDGAISNSGMTLTVFGRFTPAEEPADEVDEGAESTDEELDGDDAVAETQSDATEPEEKLSSTDDSKVTEDDTSSKSDDSASKDEDTSSDSVTTSSSESDTADTED